MPFIPGAGVKLEVVAKPRVCRKRFKPEVLVPSRLCVRVGEEVAALCDGPVQPPEELPGGAGDGARPWLVCRELSVRPVAPQSHGDGPCRHRAAVDVTVA